MSVSSMLSVIASQFDSVDNRSEFINLASLRINRCRFGAKADLATAYMAAHMIAMSNTAYRQDGTAGAVTSKREGDLSINFGSTKSKEVDGDLEQTSFGKHYLSLQNASGVMIGVTGGKDSGCYSNS